MHTERCTLGGILWRRDTHEGTIKQRNRHMKGDIHSVHTRVWGRDVGAVHQAATGSELPAKDYLSIRMYLCNIGIVARHFVSVIRKASRHLGGGRLRS